VVYDIIRDRYRPLCNIFLQGNPPENIFYNVCRESGCYADSLFYPFSLSVYPAAIWCLLVCIHAAV
jgi:hypothetical protein